MYLHCEAGTYQDGRKESKFVSSNRFIPFSMVLVTSPGTTKVSISAFALGPM